MRILAEDWVGQIILTPVKVGQFKSVEFLV